MEKNPATILFFGRPGAGKSTQAELLTTYLQANYTRRVVSFLWSYVRDEFMRGNTNVQKRLQENHAAGKLQPKFFSVSVWGPELLREMTGNEHLLIDGVPRQVFEAEALDSAFDFFDRKQVLVFNMYISREKAVARIRQRAATDGRIDDTNEEVVQHRLDWFETDTVPVLDMFKKNPRYRVIDIDADAPRSTIQSQLASHVANIYGDAENIAISQSAKTHEPAIVVSIGIPGAGKTTILKPLADRHQSIYVSRDDIRQEFFGNPHLQQDKDLIWKEAERRVRAALTAGTTVIYDATFAEQKKRRDFVASLKVMGWKNVIGFYVDTPGDVAKERNRRRNLDKIVQDDVMDTFYIEPLHEHPPSLEDGFTELYTLKEIAKFEANLLKYED
ncbi:MAG: adk, adenylate kinase, adenylate kinase [Parcubacteria group bacterium]|nr:adk, adenylate kinase, adenylate kinase [Parcubacteria group bacterium]